LCPREAETGEAAVNDPHPTPSPDGVDSVLVAAPLAGSPLVAELFAAAEPIVVALDELRVSEAWRGRLFDLLARASRPGAGEVPAAPHVPTDSRAIGLLVPLRWLGPLPAPDVVVVSDHVNARLRGPLTGRRPVGGPRPPGVQPFPSMTGVYQPETIVAACRSSVRGRVYSVSAVAGVTDAARLTPFERRAAAGACAAACDCLVDAVVVAALQGLHVAAAGVPTAANP